MSGCQTHLRRTAFIIGLIKPTRAQAPLVTGLESDKIELRARRAEVITDVHGERQEFFVHDRTDRMTTAVFRAGIAMAVSIKAGQGILRAGFEWLAQYIDRGFLC